MKKCLPFVLVLLVLGTATLHAQQIMLKQPTVQQLGNHSGTLFDASLLSRKLPLHDASAKANITLLTQDFSSTTFPPTGWTRQALSGTLQWTRGTGPQTYATFSTTGTTAANGYAFVNSDGNGGAGGAENCVLTSPAINCSGHSSVWLKFNEFFYQWLVSTANVEVSSNGSTWTTVHSAHTGLSQNQSTANPLAVDVDISSVAANQPSVYVRFHWTGSYDYYWFIDDVEVYARSAYDAALISRGNANEYSAVPLAHYNNAPFAINAVAENQGGSTINSVNMTVKVYDGFSGSILHNVTSNTLATLAPGATGTLTAASYTMPSGAGDYWAEYLVHISQTDANTLNDTLFQGLWINDSIYARDDAINTGVLDGSIGSATESLIMGQNYYIAVTDKLKRVSAYVTGAVTGDQAQILVYNTVNGLPNTQIASSAIHTFTTTAAQWVDLPIQGGPFTLSPGTYFIGLKQFSTVNNIGLGYNDNNFTPNTVYAKIGTDPWDTMSALGWDISFVIRPYLVCGTYKPVITPSNNVLCTGDQVSLTSSPGLTYLWNPGGSPAQSINITSGGTYTVSVTNSNGCAAVSNPINIPEYAKPVVFLGNDTSVCGGIMLNAGAGYQSYSWSGGSQGQQFWASSSGNVSVTVTDGNGCSGTDNINLTVTPGPQPNLGNDIIVCADQTVNLDAGGPYDTYAWSHGVSTTQYLTLDTNGIGHGTFNVYVIVSDNGCLGADTVSVTFDICSGWDETEMVDFSVFPNPVKDRLYLKLNHNDQGAEIFVYDLSGKIVLSENIAADLTTYALKTSLLNSGLYHLIIQQGNARSSVRFVRE
jgi:hypothetical protein